MIKAARHLKQRKLLVAALAVAAVSLIFRIFDNSGLPNPSSPRVSLAGVEAFVEKRFPVSHLSAAEFVQRRQKRNVVVLDIREQEEFEVSHIAGAVRVSPRETAQGLIEKFGNRLRGAEVVFYCSVGVRSSRFLQEAQPALRKLGVEQAYNLRGGIFRWHIDEKPMFRGPLQTRAVHPFDEAWGKLLERDLRHQRGDS